MKLVFSRIALGICVLSGMGSLAFGKDLTNRLGVGFKNPFSIDLPAIAAQYYPNADMALNGSLGIDTEDKQSKFGFMVRANRIVFKEDNMNFYMGGGVGLLSRQIVGTTTATETESGFQLAAFCGGEFFLPGLDSLGFTLESGVDVTSLKSGVRFRTFGQSPVMAGMFFYF